jgi:inosose dehydratase
MTAEALGTGSSGPSLRLATAPVNWNNNDIPNWRPVTPFPAILDLMRKAGYDAEEYDNAFGSNPRSLIDEAESRGMSWCGTYQWVDFLDTDTLNTAIGALAPKLDLMEAIGCRNLIVADTLRPHRVALAGRVPDDGSASLSTSQVRTLAEGVHRLADVARRRGIAVRYHNHVGSWIEAPHELDALLACLDPHAVDLCFDTGHYAYGGGNAATFIREHSDRIGYLHLKDVDGGVLHRSRKQGLSFIEALKQYVFSPIGDGSADIPSTLDVLTSTSFAGWIVVEQDTCEGDATDTARANRAFIAHWLANHLAQTRPTEGEFIR